MWGESGPHVAGNLAGRGATRGSHKGWQLGPTWEVAGPNLGGAGRRLQAQSVSVGGSVSRLQSLLATAAIGEAALPLTGPAPCQAWGPAQHMRLVTYRSKPRSSEDAVPTSRAHDRHKGPPGRLELLFPSCDSANTPGQVRFTGRGTEAQGGQATAQSHTAPRRRAGIQT